MIVQAASDPNAFWLELEGARAFEQLQFRRHRGLVALWAGLLGLAAGGGHFLPDLDGDTPRYVYGLVFGAVLTYFVVTVGLAVYFWRSFRWQGVWKKVNSWSGDGVGGFLIWFGALNGLASVVPIWLDGFETPIGIRPAYEVRVWAGVLVSFGVAFLIVNLRTRDRIELLLGASQAAAGIVFYAFAPRLAGWGPVIAAAVFVPPLILGSVRVWGRGRAGVGG